MDFRHSVATFTQLPASALWVDFRQSAATLMQLDESPL
ncbi:hypothetical protein SMF913_14318 [Streptomyces malaysiensis]|uniref:Uncharacterized protein n=1 Tax=Streptomyces malaysiensis TaxID=92644 RepID=A0A2J7ZDE7_STRMQ|nr:hypothetical protein SMF913_14318 [Streptomyces malaysiensis]